MANPCKSWPTQSSIPFPVIIRNLNLMEWFLDNWDKEQKIKIKYDIRPIVLNQQYGEIKSYPKMFKFTPALLLSPTTFTIIENFFKFLFGIPCYFKLILQGPETFAIW